jgi:hypothetical protein
MEIQNVQNSNMAIQQIMLTQSSPYIKKIRPLDSMISFLTLIKITIGQAIIPRILNSRKFAKISLALLIYLEKYTLNIWEKVEKSKQDLDSF